MLTSDAARTAALDPHSPEVWIVLLELTHPSLSGPVRLASNVTCRLSSAPLRFGVRALGHDWDFAGIEIPIPSRNGDQPTGVKLAVDIVAPEVADLVGLSTSPAQVRLYVVTKSTPDVVEAEYRRLEVKVSAVTENDQVEIELDRMPIWEEPVVMDRMTVDRFPGLHKR